MKNKDVFVNGVIRAIILLVSCIFGRIFSNMAVKLVDLFVMLDFITASGIRAVTLVLFSAFFAALGIYKYGYHFASFDKKGSISASALGALVHLGVAALTWFTPWTSGGTMHIAGFISMGSNYTDVEYMFDIPYTLMLSVSAVTAVLYAVVLCIFECAGTKKRLKDREAIMASEN